MNPPGGKVRYLMDIMSNPVYGDPIARPASHEDEGRGINTGLAFLAENPEAFGLVSEACPVSARNILVAASGHGMEVSVGAPTYSVDSADLDALFDAPFGGLLPRTSENETLLRATFGARRGRGEHLVSRLGAVLCEAVALQVLQGSARGASPEQTALLLGWELRAKLNGFRDSLRATGNLPPRAEAALTVSFAACRVRDDGVGDYKLDLFSAGDFRVFLLDRKGMHPLGMQEAALLSPDEDVRLAVRTVSVHHPEPFALLLLSDSVCALNAAEYRTLRENPGMIWRYRMRLEDRFLRLITDCVWENEFGERATRYFTGRTNGYSSSSGAMLLRMAGGAYEVLRTNCRKRLTELESVISLLPEGYDAANRPAQPARVETERAYLRRLFDRDPTLETRMMGALRLCILEKLNAGDEEVCPPPEGVPAYVRLKPSDVAAVFRRYDSANDGDRALIEENGKVLRESLSDHWVSLRPAFLAAEGREGDRPLPEERSRGDRLFETCLLLGGRLSATLAERRAVVDTLAELLAEASEVLRVCGNDWVCGRAGTDGAAAWAATLEERLPEALAPLRRGWPQRTDEYRSYLSAYAHEREKLFRLDISAPNGFFAADWEGIRAGTLPDARWQALRRSLTASPETAGYVELLDSIRRISRGTARLTARIRSRAAEDCTVREMTARPELLLAALRGAVNEDLDWGADVLSLVDNVIRGEYRTVVRRWQETCELHTRQAEAFEAYRAMYEGDIL